MMPFLWILVFTLATASDALAQSTDAASEPALALARVLYTEGVEAAGRDNWTTAHDRFTRERGGVHSSQRRANARQQFLSTKGLGDVVIGARIQRSHLVAFGTASRQDEDWNAGRLSHLTAHINAVHVRQTEVEHDQIRLVAFDGIQTRSPGHRRRDLVPARTEQGSHGAQDVGLIVHDEDTGRHILLGHRCWPDRADNHE